MLKLKKQEHLNNLSNYEGMSLREIAAHTGHHFNTVKKYVDKENWNDGYTPRKERKSLLEPLYDVIDKWLKEDRDKGRKYRRSATKIYNDLKADEEYSKLLVVCKQTVINYVGKRKKELYNLTYKTAMFALHLMSEAAVRTASPAHRNFG